MDGNGNGKDEIRGLDVLRESSKIDEELYEFSKKSAEFHGHLCPGLAVGIIASKIALKDARRAEDEELVAMVENDACGVDGIQALTGCTFGKGNLVFNDYGKSVYTFFNRTTGKGLRLSLKAGVFESGKGNRARVLFAKVRNDTATNEEREEFERLHLEQTREMLERGEDMFTTSVLEMEPPEMARLFDSVLCDDCGEPVMATRTIARGDKTLCIPCSDAMGEKGVGGFG